MLPENDIVALTYIANNTGRFTELDIKMFGKECTNYEIGITRNIVSEIADYDYDFNDGYVQIQLTQLVNMILF